MKYSKMYCNILIIQLILLFIMPGLDQLNTIWAWITYGTFAILSIVAVSIFLLCEKKRIGKAEILVGIFFIICLLSAIWGFIVFNNPIADIVRGVLPFSWYIYILIIPYLEQKEINKIVTTVAGVSLLYAIRIIVYYMIFVWDNPGQRVTFHLSSATAMMTMVGLLIFIYKFFNKNKWYYLGIILNFMAIVLTATKSMLIASVIGIVIILVLYFIKIKNIEGIILIKKTIILLMTLIIISVGIFASSEVGQRWEESANVISNMQEDDETDEGNDKTNEGDQVISENSESNSEDSLPDGSIMPRIEEYKMAYENWKESPIMGKGIGYRWESDRINYGEPVIFVHNVIMWILMDLGILGLLFIAIVVIAFLIMLVKHAKMKEINNFELSFSILVMAFVYANFFAIFRNIEFTLLCAIFISIAVSAVNVEKQESTNQ